MVEEAQQLPTSLRGDSRYHMYLNTLNTQVTCSRISMYAYININAHTYIYTWCGQDVTVMYE